VLSFLEQVMAPQEYVRLSDDAGIFRELRSALGGIGWVESLVRILSSLAAASVSVFGRD
jgi:hypothetical protein